nr:ATP-binding cassette domain-containing protein [Pseudomonas sp.]
MSPLLQVENLTRHFPIAQPGLWAGKPRVLRAVNGVSFGLAPGKTLGLVGESGCGKSTTAKLVLGMMAPSSGAVRFDGRVVPARRSATWRALRQRMQMVYQDPLSALDRRLPVMSQVIEPLTIFRRGTPAERRDSAREMLDAVGLTPNFFDRYPHELSGGQRQRVVLARALVLRPSLLVCDEPISALDVSIQAQVVNLLGDLQQRFSVAMLFISHDLRVVRQISDEVAVMYLGRIVEQGPPQELFREPAHPYTKALISAIPSPWRDPGQQRIVLTGDPPSPMDLPTGCAFHPRCPAATSHCRAAAPALAALGRTRKVACHLVHQPT